LQSNRASGAKYLCYLMWNKLDFVQILLAAHSRRQEDLYKVERF
jgi:hypothetical protein